jgi:hypothetical protein
MRKCAELIDKGVEILGTVTVVFANDFTLYMLFMRPP